MRRLTVNEPSCRQIEINGIVFDILISDFEAMSMIYGLIDLFEGLKEGDFKDVMSAVSETLLMTDKILGDGAMEKILGGRAANINFMISEVLSPLLAAVVEEGAEGYSQRIAEDYE